MLRRQKRRNHSHLQCSLWSQCWGISCWCTWWPSPCPFLSAGEDASLGRRTSATEHTTTAFYWTLHYLRSALLSLMPSAATVQLTLGQPSEPPAANMKRKGSACLQFKLGQPLFSHQKRFIISCVQEQILSNNFILIFYAGNHQRLLGSFLGLWCRLGRPESWYPRSHSRRK